MPLSESELQLRVDDRHQPNFTRVRDFEFGARQPFVKIPGSARKGAGRCRHYEFADRFRFDGLEELRQNAKINAFPLHGEHQLACKARFGTMARGQQNPV